MSRKNETKELYLKSIEEQDNFLFDSIDNIVFNFKFFLHGKNFGQSFEEWEREKILADLNNKLKDFSNKTIADLLKNKTLEFYNQYPKGSKFQKPNIFKNIEITWCRLRITGTETFNRIYVKRRNSKRKFKQT